MTPERFSLPMPSTKRAFELSVGRGASRYELVLSNHLPVLYAHGGTDRKQTERFMWLLQGETLGSNDYRLVGTVELVSGKTWHLYRKVNL